MPDLVHIGIYVNAAIEFGRQILLGAGQWVRGSSQCRLLVISDSGDASHIRAGRTPLDAIVAQAGREGELDALSRLCPRIVLVSNRQSHPTLPQVLNDDQAIGRMAFRHLYARGYRSFAFLALQVHQYSREREVGFRGEAERVGLPVITLKHASRADLAETPRELNGLPQPVGLLVATDFRARELIANIPDAAQRIPFRWAVLGVDDDPLQNALSAIPLSSVRPSGARIGFEAMSLAAAWVGGQMPPREPLRVLPQYVAARRSTDYLEIADPLVARALRTIEQNVAQLPTVEALADRIKVARRTLEKRFRRALGRTLAQTLLDVRLREAQVLLSTTALTGSEISDLVGFSEPRMLSLVFRRELGETPTQFRARAQPGLANR